MFHYHPTATEKARIRALIKERKKSISQEEKTRQAERVFKAIEAMPVFKTANSIFLYWSLPDELPTHDFIIRWSSTKTILLPVVDGDKLLLRVFNGKDQLSPGTLNIMEPTSTQPPIISPDLILAPGIAFDKSRRRIGRGGGYYDRFLQHNNIPVWGVGFDFQLFDEIPAEAFDIRMDKVITPDLIVE